MAKTIIEKIIKSEQKEMALADIYVDNVNLLFEKCVRIFKWNNSPKNLPQREIEKYAIALGFCGFVNDKKCGYMVSNGGMSGPTQYDDVFKNFTYSRPTAKGGTVTIGKDCVIIRNTSMMNPLSGLIRKSASQLAHADITLRAALVNYRANEVFSADDDSTAESINAYYTSLYEGNLKAIVDYSLINGVKNLSSSKSYADLLKLTDVKNEIMRSFFAEIGIRQKSDKRERLVTEEVESDSMMLLFNIHDMLEQRQKACEEINKIFNLNMSVELSEEWDYLKKERGVNDEISGISGKDN